MIFSMLSLFVFFFILSFLCVSYGCCHPCFIINKHIHKPTENKLNQPTGKNEGKFVDCEVSPILGFAENARKVGGSRRQICSQGDEYNLYRLTPTTHTKVKLRRNESCPTRYTFSIIFNKGSKGLRQWPIK